MNPDSFEEKLRSQPGRTVPPDWRQEILARARREAPGGTSQVMNPPARPWLLWLREALWPNPIAWGAQVCIWIIALLLNVPFAERNDVQSQASEPSHLEKRLAREQREFIAEEFGASALSPIWSVGTPRQPAGDGSRTQRRIDTIGVAEQCANSFYRKELV